MPEVRDFFICHAREDKAEIVAPLIEALARKKITYWYDNAEILLGDSIPRKINEGLAKSRYVVVILSPNFVKKPYPQEEFMSALNQQASTGETKVLPILVGSDQEIKQILDQYPLLQSRYYITWDGNPDNVVEPLLQRVPPLSRSRVCFISSEYPPYVFGGLGVHVNQLTLALAEHLDIDVVLPSPGNLEYQSSHPRIQIRSLSDVSALYEKPLTWLYFADNAADWIAQLARTSRPDVIHCHDWVTVLAGIKCRWRLKIPLVFHLHLPNRSPLCASVENLGLICADLVTVNSQAMWKELRDRKIPLPPVEVVKNGVDPNEFRPCEDWPADDGYILFVGRLVKQKGVEYLLRAIYCARERFPNIRLKIVGKGELRPILERLRTNLLLSNHVEFTDWQTGSELVKLYQKAQVVVVPSIYEPFGMTALEAMACQRPVVASRVGGLKEIIEHTRTGFLAEPKDHLDLAQWIMTLLSNPDLRHDIGKAGQAVISKGYTWRQIAQNFTRLYEDLPTKNSLDKKNIPDKAGQFRDQIRKVATDLSNKDSAVSTVLDRLFDWGI